MEKVLCSSKGKQQTRIKSREDLTSVIVTLILLVTHCAMRNGWWDASCSEKETKTQQERLKFGSCAQKSSASGQCGSLGFLVASTESVVRYRHGALEEMTHAPLLLRNKQLWGTHLDKLNHIFPVRELFLMFKAHRAIDVNRLKNKSFPKSIAHLT